MKTIQLMIVAAVSVLIGFAAGYWTATVTAPETRPAPARTVKAAEPLPSGVIRTSIDPRTGRTLYHTKRGKTYYLTPGGNRVYQTIPSEG